VARAKASNINDDVVEFERELSGLLREIESRVGRLNTLTRRSASGVASQASDYVSESFAETMERMRNGVQAATDEAARLGGDALQKVEDEVERRPLMTVAIAAGIGFLAGMASRRL
jgi:ElaB/YqjD/DUF883 family membrane-anchored ribosome-binding protein